MKGGLTDPEGSLSIIFIVRPDFCERFFNTKTWLLLQIESIDIGKM